MTNGIVKIMEFGGAWLICKVWDFNRKDDNTVYWFRKGQSTLEILILVRGHFDSEGYWWIYFEFWGQFCLFVYEEQIVGHFNMMCTELGILGVNTCGRTWSLALPSYANLKYK